MSDAAEREGLAAFMLRAARPRRCSEARRSPRSKRRRARAFLDVHYRDLAWSDRMLPIECGEAIEGVDLQAQIIYALGFEPGHRVLEVGTGTGYTAAVISRLAGRVTTLDRYKTLIDLAKQRFELFGIQNVTAKQTGWFEQV